MTNTYIYVTVTTIAGPPQIDEEDLSTDSEEDEERMEERDGDTVEEQQIQDVSANENNNLVFSPSPVKKPIALDDNTDDENDYEDDEDDGLFYTPSTSKIGKSGRIQFSPLITSSADVNAKRRKRLQLGHNRWI